MGVEQLWSITAVPHPLLNFLYFVNDSNILTEICMLVSFDIVNLFHNIDYESDLEAVKNLKLHLIRNTNVSQ